jgi:hypothetical protein
MVEGYFGHFDELPEDVRDVFMLICQEVTNMMLKWRLYLDIFGDPENHPLLHDTALFAFRSIEESLRIDISMTISRLADPPNSAGHENLSLARLCTLYPTDRTLRNCVMTFKADCSALIQHRMKLLAHSDLRTKLDPQNNLLQGIGRPDIERIMKSAVETLTYVVRAYTGQDIVFDASAPLGGESLIYWLRKGWDTEHYDS